MEKITQKIHTFSSSCNTARWMKLRKWVEDVVYMWETRNALGEQMG
jgi:hypothetical protein